MLDLAASAGLLEAAGLEVVEHPVPSSPAQFRALASGELQVALTSPDNVLAYRFNPDNPLGGLLDARVVGAVDRALGLDDELARRYVERLRSPDEGLVPGAVVDTASLETLVGLRRTYLPQPIDGHDVMDAALAEDSGLVDVR